MTLEDWKARLKATFLIYRVPDDLQVPLALNSLEGEARRTILLRPDDEREELEEIYSILGDIYGDTSSAGTLRQRLFGRFQREDESIPQYANALQEMMGEVRRKDPDGFGALTNTSQILRDQFAMGLRNVPLRQVMLDKISQDDTLTFHQVEIDAVARDRNANYGPHAVFPQWVQPISAPVASRETNPLETCPEASEAWALSVQVEEQEGACPEWNGTIIRTQMDVSLDECAAGDRERYRPIPPRLYQEVKSMLRQMLDNHVIQESKSPWAAPIVLVRKKDGTIRFCVDYRKLNSCTVRDAYPLPRIEESLAALGNAKFFSTLDLASGYWQVPVAPQDREKTAFVTPMGLFEFCRMPFGLNNAPATFQRMMERCLGDLNFEALLIYLDDIIVFAATLEEHFARLDRVLQRLEEYGLKLKPRKCHLLNSSLEYLGHVVSRDGVYPTPSKVAAVQEWKVPTTVTELRAFLGLVGYYRRFIKDFARIAEPLHALLRGIATTKRAALETWGEAQNLAFDRLKASLTEAPVLGYADFEKPFVLYTDGSLQGLGAVLAQVQDGQERVIAYGSRSLRETERNPDNYSSFKLELLAVVWAVTEKFAEYLTAAHVDIFTDNNPLAYLETAKLGALEQRWVARLAKFSYKIRYRSGKSNTNADALSRFPVETPEPGGEEDDCGEEMPDLTRVRQPVGGELCRQDAQTALLRYTETDWAQEQQADEGLDLIRQWVQRGHMPSRREQDGLTGFCRKVVRRWDQLRVCAGTLRRQCYLEQEMRTVEQVVVPEARVRSVVEEAHEQGAHLGPYKTYHWLRRQYFAPRLQAVVDQVCRECRRCAVVKPQEQHVPIQTIRTSRPLEMLMIDYVLIGESVSGHQYALVMTDHFTKFTVVVPTRNQTAESATRAIVEHFIRQYGCPERIHSDQGACFQGQLMERLCQLYGVQKSRTTPYHPQGNGACERFNRTLLQMLRVLERAEKQRWPEHVQELVWTYNNRVHHTTGFSPFFLLFGRPGREAHDLQLSGTEEGTPLAPAEWVEDHRLRLKAAHELAGRLIADHQHPPVRSHEPGSLAVGQRVLVREVRPGGKLSERWEVTPYLVRRRLAPGGPVYQVESTDGTGRLRTLHRSKLRPCPFLDPVSGAESPVAEDGVGAPAWEAPAPLSDEEWWSPVEENRPEEASEPQPPADVVASPLPRRSLRSNRGVPGPRYADPNFVWSDSCFPEASEAWALSVQVEEQEGACPEWNGTIIRTQMDVSLDECAAGDVAKLDQMLWNRQKVFSRHEEDFGYTEDLQHEIRTGDAPPVRERVLQRLEEYGLKLKPRKCHLLKSSLEYLGHVVSRDGVYPTPSKVAAVQEWKVPTTVTELRAFLGLVGYYRRFIKDFARIAEPLHALLRGIATTKRAALETWGEAQNLAFDRLKASLTEAPVLGYADFEKPFVLYTDGSLQGLGAVLAQVQDGQERVIAYGSRSLRETERNPDNYSSFKLELLVVVWAVTEKFAEYLTAAHVDIFTDNNPLAYLENAKLGALEQRWVARLAKFSYKIRYRSGKSNTNADALSRFPVETPEPGGEEDDCGEEMPDLTRVRQPVGGELCRQDAQTALLRYTETDWAQEQQADEGLDLIRQWVQRGHMPSRRQQDGLTGFCRKVVRRWDQLRVCAGTLRRQCYLEQEMRTVEQVVVPEARVRSVVEEAHEQGAHLGPYKTYHWLRRQYFAPRLQAVVDQVCRECRRCAVVKPQEQHVPIQTIRTSRPLEMLMIDYVLIGESVSGHQYALVMTDHFTKFTVVVPTRNQTAESATRAIVEHFIRQYGCPERIHSDQGACFQGQLMERLCQLYGVQKSRTTPYHPQGNGACERFNRTLLQMLRVLERAEKQRWPEHVQELVWTYNNRVHHTTGFSPFLLLFGRPGREAHDLQLSGTEEGTPLAPAEWVEDHRLRLKAARELAGRLIADHQHPPVRSHEPGSLAVGQRVLVREVRPGGKLSEWWEVTPYLVRRRLAPGGPVYQVESTDGTGRLRTLHRSKLRPCPFLDPVSGAESPVAEDGVGAPAWEAPAPLSDEEWWSPVEENRPEEASEPQPPADVVASPLPRRSLRSNRGVPGPRYADPNFVWSDSCFQDYLCEDPQSGKGVDSCLKMAKPTAKLSHQQTTRLLRRA
ncbi:uncharacterized protein LOC135062022 [Pseudophryne corroboree]|uniref:uncharacterized protein LOC135062022 n=1 Tax=Pseudophryne corroboree TaxID=495146 RepID=UPI00308130EC